MTRKNSYKLPYYFLLLYNKVTSFFVDLHQKSQAAVCLRRPLTLPNYNPNNLTCRHILLCVFVCFNSRPTPTFSVQSILRLVLLGFHAPHFDVFNLGLGVRQHLLCLGQQLLVPHRPRAVHLDHVLSARLHLRRGTSGECPSACKCWGLVMGVWE